MPITTRTPGPDGLTEAVRALREWQHDGAPVQLHPGDLGWFWRFGPHATASAVRTWSRDGQVLAVGLLDGPGLLRVGIAPHARQDQELARRMAADVVEPARGVLPAGAATVEARSGELLLGLLREAGWEPDEPWTPLRRDLAEPVTLGPGRVEVVGPEQAEVRAALQRAAFDGSRFSAEHWRAMAAGPVYADARCLVAHDERGTAVATATVWSAGPGRPGLLEPMGVDRDHRGRGHGVAITLAAAATLRGLGASSVVVATESANLGAVATYRSAGFEELAESRDVRRTA